MARSRPRPRKTQPDFAAERAELAIMGRVNPIRGLTPDRASSALDAFDLGYLRSAARLWQKIKDRCDTTKAVSEKRELSVALLDYEILQVDDSAEAARDKAALEEFYDNVVTTHALDTNQRGGVSTLIKQMMHCMGHKYAVHEIVWQPSAGRLGAEFRFVPLEYFENTRGRLRFLAYEGAALGEELEEGGWMVTTGAGLMEATTIAYLYKQLPLKSWLILCEKFAVPYLHGETTATFGSDEWKDFRDALRAFASDGGVVTGPGGKINPIQIQGTDTPQDTLVDRMDRAISRLWRGNDLGTMSREGDATGSNPQESETDILEAADAKIVSDTLNHYVDRQVLRYRFGSTAPKAYFKLQPTVRENMELQLKIDECLIKWGVPRGKNDLREKYGRPEPEASDDIAGQGPAPSDAGASGGDAGSASSSEDVAAALINEAVSAGRDAIFKAEALAQAAPEVRAAIRPLIERLAQIHALTDATERRRDLQRLQAALPELYRTAIARVPAAAAVFEEIAGAAFASGQAEQTQSVAKSQVPSSK